MSVNEYKNMSGEQCMAHLEAYQNVEAALAKFVKDIADIRDEYYAVQQAFRENMEYDDVSERLNEKFIIMNGRLTSLEEEATSVRNRLTMRRNDLEDYIDYIRTMGVF